MACPDELQPSVTRATRGISTYRTSGRFLELPTIDIRATFSPIENYRTSGRFLEGCRHWSSVTYWIFTNLPDMQEVLWNGLTSEFGHLSGIGKPAEHPKSFALGTFVTGTTLFIHSSYRFAENRGSTRNTHEQSKVPDTVSSIQQTSQHTFLPRWNSDATKKRRILSILYCVPKILQQPLRRSQQAENCPRSHELNELIPPWKKWNVTFIYDPTKNEIILITRLELTRKYISRDAIKPDSLSCNCSIEYERRFLCRSSNLNLPFLKYFNHHNHFTKCSCHRMHCKWSYKRYYLTSCALFSRF